MGAAVIPAAAAVVVLVVMLVFFYVWEARWGQRSNRLLQNNKNIRFIMKGFL